MTPNRILIYGGQGALGSACLKYFKSKLWWVVSIDLTENSEADHAIGIHQSNCESLSLQYQQVEKNISDIMDENDHKFDAIINVAGGWCGGNAHSKDFIKNCELSLKQSVWSSCISAALAAKYLKQEGLLVLPSASASLQPTPGMVAYGMAKVCVNHITSSVGQKEGGLPPNSTALAILPIILDTPMNRKWMPNADVSTFTPLDILSRKIYEWCTNKEVLPASGSLIQVKTFNGETIFDVLK